MGRYAAEQATFSGKWRLFTHLGFRLNLMVRNTLTQGVAFAPLYIHSFKLIQPHFLEAKRFSLQGSDPNLLTHTADKLRWFRYRSGLLQQEVSRRVGMDRSTYAFYESRERDAYPMDKLLSIVEMFGISVEDLLDNYNRFLQAQSETIQRLRLNLGMTQWAYAAHLDVPIGALKKWESGRSQISKPMWERLFKGTPL